MTSRLIPFRLFASGIRPVFTPKCGRGIFTGLASRQRTFEQVENSHSIGLMRTKLGYDIPRRSETPPTTSMTPEEFDAFVGRNWSDRNPDELGSAFGTISDYARVRGVRITEERFDAFVDALTDGIRSMDRDGLKRVFVDLSKWPETETIHSRNFIEVWTALDDALRERFSNDVKDILDFSYYVNLLHLTKKFDFTWKGTVVLERKSKQLTKEQLVRTMYLYSLCRKSSKFMMNFQQSLEKHLEHMSIEEVGIVCSGFFKTQTQLRGDEIVKRVIRKLIENAKVADEFLIAMIAKQVRYSATIGVASDISKLLDALTPRIDGLSMACLVQMSLVGTTSYVFHATSLNKIAQNFIDDPSRAKIKDIERLTFVFAEFYRVPETTVSFFDTVVDELRKPERAEELLQYGKSAVRTLSFLAYFQIFPKDLINKVLDEEFLKRCYPMFPHFKYSTTMKGDGCREILLLDDSVKIECEDYSGNEIGSSVRQRLGYIFTDWVPEIGYGAGGINKIILEIMDILKSARGSNAVHCENIVPHFQKGSIIIGIDRNGRPIEVKNYFQNIKDGTIVRAPDDVNMWFALVVIGKYSFIANTVSYLGPFVTHLRQLRKLGFRPITIKANEWKRLNSTHEKEIYLHNVITQHIKNEEEGYTALCN